MNKTFRDDGVPLDDMRSRNGRDDDESEHGTEFYPMPYDFPVDRGTGCRLKLVGSAQGALLLYFCAFDPEGISQH
ncbi:MAG: hypothetical protein ABIJ86_04075 [Spirochaetota bacterium]